MSNIKFPYAPALAWGIFIFVLSILPGKDFPSIPNWGSLLSLDKVVHMIFYSVLTWLILHGKQKNMVRTLHQAESMTEGGISLSFAGGIAVFSSGFGWFLEWFQGAYCEDRMSDVLDGIANTIGAVIGLLVFLYFQKKNRLYNNA